GRRARQRAGRGGRRAGDRVLRGAVAPDAAGDLQDRGRIPVDPAVPDAAAERTPRQPHMTNYLIAMATFGAIYAILALGLNVMWGMAGMVNLGIVGFYGFGAYISALLTVKGHAPIAL